MSHFVRWVVKLLDNILANMIATVIVTAGISVWAVKQEVPAYGVAAIALGVAAGTLLLIVQLRQLFWQSYGAFYLGILRDVGITMLLNRPVSSPTDETKLGSDLNAWGGQVVDVMRRVGARDSEIRRFITLGSVPVRHQGSTPNHTSLLNQIAEKLSRLEAVIDRLDRP